MENNRNLFKEAIAEAKAVKEVSIANAKAALEEALTPRLKSMFEQKLAEMDAKDMYTEEEEETDEVFDLEELLAELDGSDEEGEEVEETGEVESEDDVEIDFDNMTEEDLRTFIEEVVDEMIEANELDVDSDEEDTEEEEVGIEDVELDVDGDEIEIEEVTGEGNDEMQDHEEGAINDDKDHIKKLEADKKEDEEELAKLKADHEKDLNEAITAVKALRTELTEVNLLNSKLLYLNRILKGTNLRESQKVKTIAAFDKAETVKEVKLVYETLQESFTRVSPKETTRKLIRESKNFASSAIIGASPKQPVMEVDPMITRMKKLAGLL